MSEQTNESKAASKAGPAADLKPDAEADAAAETAALPLIESPAISPETIGDAAPAEAGVAETAAAEIAPAVEPVSDAAGVAPSKMPTASQRFREAAAVQIAAARQRLEQRKASSVMAVALMASLAGGCGTVLATSAIAQFASPSQERVAQTRTLNDALARIEDEIAALRGKLDRAAELHAAQAETTVERLDRIEKAQAEPVAKLSKLAELVEKLRFTPVARAGQIAAATPDDITGSVKTAPASGTKPKRTIVEGWTLREVDRDAALIEGKRGLFETYVGDTIPGVGRVEGFRKQDGQWVIVTAKGLIVSR